MVIMKNKISRVETSKMETNIKDELSEDDTLDTGSEVSENEEEHVETEPAPKKVKRDVTKEAEKELNSYDVIVNDPEIKFTEKLSQVSLFLQSVFENNVNTLEFERNFNDWMKITLVHLLDEGTVASEEFYIFLCNVLKVSPTIIESTCEKVLTFIFTRHHFIPESNLAFENFMENLSCTFEKLRRYPKLIAKLLCCVRDNIKDIYDQGGLNSLQKFMKKMLGHKSKDKSIFILPKRFMTSYASIVSMLSSGQIVDLWKTLHHNLEEECIKKCNISNPVPINCFLSVVVDLLVSFLCSIKVVDYSVPASTVEKVVDMMNKLKENSISKLASSLPSEYDSSYTFSFLKLCNAWSRLHHFMCIYNEKYTNNLSECTITNCQPAVDISFFLPQLSSDEWTSLWNKIDKNKDAISASLMVSLVALKLNCLGVIQQKQKRGIIEVSEDSTMPLEDANSSLKESDILQMNIQKVAKFLWIHQQSLKLEQVSGFISSCEDTLRITSAYLHQDELIEYAKTFLDNMLVSAQSTPNLSNVQQQLSSNMKFRVAVVLESIYEGVKRVGKGNSMKRQVTKFLSECLNPICKNKILKSLEVNESKRVTLDLELKKIMMDAVLIVNDVVKEERCRDSEDQISAVLLKEIISLIGHEELTQYPTVVKTVIFLSVLLMFSALVKHCKENADVLDNLCTVLSECGRNSQGNDVLFHVQWIELFGLVKANADLLSEKGTKDLCSLMLENIYISSKIGKDFGDQYIKGIGENDDFTITSTDGCLLFCILDHILGEGMGAKTRSTSVLTDHAKELCTIVLNQLSNGSVITDLHDLIHSLKKHHKKDLKTPTKKKKLPDACLASRAMGYCYLLLKGKQFMNPEVVNEITEILMPYLQFALDYFELSNKAMQLANAEEAKPRADVLHCIQFILEALKNFQEHREKLPPNFLSRVWSSSFALYSSSDDEICKKIQTELPKLNLEVADELEFQSICDSIVERMDVLDDVKKLAVAAHMLSNLISSETSSDKKKQIRRATIELCMFKYLEYTNLWKESTDFVQSATPYIHFQISLLKRRKPMGSLSTLSICMSSITSLPLERIESVGSFKTMFSLICDLLNAFNVHRLDVIAFRSHVFVQCFQFLVEHLVKRADQRNKLTDKEIYDLRHCAHGIERVCQSAKLGREELARVSPYLVVILLRQFEKITVYPIVKNPLLNGCYKLLDMCDDQGISHVNSMLSAGSREIFKTIYELYKTFYRYKGKV